MRPKGLRFYGIPIVDTTPSILDRHANLSYSSPEYGHNAYVKEIEDIIIIGTQDCLKECSGNVIAIRMQAYLRERYSYWVHVIMMAVQYFHCCHPPVSNIE